MVREPMMVGEEPPAREKQEAWQGWGAAGDGRDLQHLHQQGEGSPILTTVTFRLGLWTACPHINTSHLHASQYHQLAAPQCSSVSYGWRPVTHKDLRLPAPAPLMQTVLARMRLSTMFLVGACGLLGAGCLLAVVGRCCYSHAALLAALLYSLAGLSVGVGVVWFVSVVSEEYGVASGRRTSWSAMYAYHYGWSLMAAGGAGVSAMLAALLTGHAHLGRHAPLLGTRTSSLEESLARPLLRCRSEGCLGQRSFTSDTIRTYLTCDSRRHASRSSHVSQPPSLHQCSSIVDLTRPQEHPPPPPAPHLASRRSSRATVLSDDTQHLQQHPPKEQQQTQTQQHDGQQEHQTQEQQLQQKEQQQQQQQKKEQQQQQQQEQQQQQQQKPQQQQQQGGGRAWPVEPSRVIIEAPHGVLPPVVPPPPLSSSSSSPSPLDLPLSLPAVVTSTTGGRTMGIGRPAKVEPPRLPEYSSFKGDYTRSLPREARQMAVFDRRGGQRSATLSRPPAKASSEV